MATTAMRSAVSAYELVACVATQHRSAGALVELSPSRYNASHSLYQHPPRV